MWVSFVYSSLQGKIALQIKKCLSEILHEYYILYKYVKEAVKKSGGIMNVKKHYMKRPVNGHFFFFFLTLLCQGRFASKLKTRTTIFPY